MTSTGNPRYPDLAGKTAVIAGAGDAVLEVVRLLAEAHVQLAVVVADRALVTASTQLAEEANVAAIGLAGDPRDDDVWRRNAPHIEQRLGPVDIAIAIGPAALRQRVAKAFIPDMRARHLGVFVEVDSTVSAEALGDGVRHRCIQTANLTAVDIAEAVASCVSDVASRPVTISARIETPQG